MKINQILMLCQNGLIAFKKRIAVKNLLPTAIKSRVTVLVVLFTFSFNAFAIGILLPAAAVTGIALATGLSVNMVTAIEGSVLLHAAVLAIKLASPDTPEDQAPLEIRLDPKKPLSVPAGWQAGVDGAQPIPPDTVSPSHAYYSSGGERPTQHEACQAAADVYHGTIASEGGLICIINHPAGFTLDLGLGETNFCETGYSMGGDNQCHTILNGVPPMKPSDGKCTIDAFGGSITPDARDPDCSNADLLAQGIDLTEPNKVTIQPKGSAKKTEVTAKPDGHIEVKNSQPKGADTQVDKIDIAPSATAGGSPTVEGISREITPGQGTLSSGNSSGTLNFDKTGLATTANQATQISQLDTIKTQQCGYDAAHPCKIDAEGETDTIQSITDKKNEYDTAYADAKGNLENWSSIPELQSKDVGFRAGTCTDFQPIFNGHTIPYNLCEKQPIIKSIFAWILYLLTGGILYGIFLQTPRKA